MRVSGACLNVLLLIVLGFPAAEADNNDNNDRLTAFDPGQPG